MPKVLHLPQSISTPSISSDKTVARNPERDAFVSVALFSGIGLLISLIAVLCGVPGAWY